MANFGSVFSGTVAGMIGAGMMFYGITVRQAFGGTRPVDQDETWQVKSEDMMVDGKWHLQCKLHCLSKLDWDVLKDWPEHNKLHEVVSVLCCTELLRMLQKREAGGSVHLNPIKYHISGRDYAMQVMQPAPRDEDDEEDEDDD